MVDLMVPLCCSKIFRLRQPKGNQRFTGRTRESRNHPSHSLILRESKKTLSRSVTPCLSSQICSDEISVSAFLVLSFSLLSSSSLLFFFPDRRPPKLFLSPGCPKPAEDHTRKRDAIHRTFDCDFRHSLTLVRLNKIIKDKSS